MPSMQKVTVKPVKNGHSQEHRKSVFKNCRGEHSAILSTFIKLPIDIKIFVLSFFEWPFYTGFMWRRCGVVDKPLAL